MRRARGFSLIEAVVSILILSVVMIVALTLLVSMRSFAAKQQAFTGPRQTARGAVDYISFFLAGASDLNVEVGNPNAIVVWTTKGVAAAPKQATYNDLTAAQEALGFGDLGTDIITFSVPSSPTRIPVMRWTGTAAAGNSAFLNFSAGCGPAVDDNAANLTLFKTVTGATGTLGNEVSGLLTVQDSEGRWRYFRISRYVASDCSAMLGADPTKEVVEVEFIPGNTDQLNPPGGWRGDFVGAVTVNAGVDYTSFRVRNRTLEQKTTGWDGAGVLSPGMFDPDCDGTAKAGGCPTIGFTPVVENVEDLQVAYVFRDGFVLNNAAPGQAQTDPTTTLDARDVSNVRAVRLSVIARSNPLDIGVRQLSIGQAARGGLYQRPALEDHAAGALDTVASGVFDRYRLTTTLVLRNRMLGY